MSVLQDCSHMRYAHSPICQFCLICGESVDSLAHRLWGES